MARIGYNFLVLDNFLFYLKLTWVCLKLAFNLFVFALNFLLIKINAKKLLNISLLSLIILSIGLNLLIIKQKNTPQVEIQHVEIFEKTGLELPKSQLVTMTENEVLIEIEQLQKLESLNIKSLGLLLNLSQLNKALDQDQPTKEYFKQAKQIAPQINYLEKN
ncbi:MAG: hypothetical protein US20_C0030G0006 [Candidatus Pacebacteria bacterium GW2011_GWF1_36_5]|nr:MAG: hypothetical protein US20_C0030G0006 [Candidatus Pacebacteria bacterium GW2011_GWF1_36_5]HAZ73012.1 hypothetical protein [Candidatus Paceibacterota bacterium]